jgi:NADH:ubiquinone oxidoreductase subunit K
MFNGFFKSHKRFYSVVGVILAFLGYLGILAYRRQIYNVSTAVSIIMLLAGIFIFNDIRNSE